MISPEAQSEERSIKSVTCTGGISILKVHSASIGIRPNLLSNMISAMADEGIHILGMSTSQACLGVVLRSKDVERAQRAVKEANLPELEGIEAMSGLALVGAVGSGALEDPTVVPRMMATIADLGESVATLAAGPSSAAIFFVIKEDVSSEAVRLVHATFCESDPA